MNNTTSLFAGLPSEWVNSLDASDWALLALYHCDNGAPAEFAQALMAKAWEAAETLPTVWPDETAH